MPRPNRSVTEPLNTPANGADAPESTLESGATVDVSSLTEDQYATLGVTEQEFNELSEEDQNDLLATAGIKLPEVPEDAPEGDEPPAGDPNPENADTDPEKDGEQKNEDLPATTDTPDAGDEIQKANEEKAKEMRTGEEADKPEGDEPDVTVGGTPQRGMKYDPANPKLDDPGRIEGLPLNAGEISEKDQPNKNLEALKTDPAEQEELKEVKAEGSQTAEERAKVNTVQAPEPIKTLQERPLPKAAVEMAAPVETETPESEVRQPVYAPRPEEAHKTTNSSLEVAEYQNENHPAFAHSYVKTNDNPQQDALRKSEMVEASHYQNPRNPGETMATAVKEPAITEGQLQIKFAQGQQAMRKELESQPRVKFFIPLEQGDPKNAQAFVGINGLFMWVPKGKYIDVPEQVAQVLAESLQIDMTAGEEYRIDRDGGKQNSLSGASDAVA